VAESCPDSTFVTRPNPSSVVRFHRVPNVAVCGFAIAAYAYVYPASAPSGIFVDWGRPYPSYVIVPLAPFGPVKLVTAHELAYVTVVARFAFPPGVDGSPLAKS
jgi:hypothetical protein